jgi:hypothetical protein
MDRIFTDRPLLRVFFWAVLGSASDLFGVNADWPCVRVPGSVVVCR